MFCLKLPRKVALMSNSSKIPNKKIMALRRVADVLIPGILTPIGTFEVKSGRRDNSNIKNTATVTKKALQSLILKLPFFSPKESKINQKFIGFIPVCKKINIFLETNNKKALTYGFGQILE